MSKQLIVTEAGLQKMKDELEYLKTTRRKEVADRLKDAISYGDLSENSEYQEAKEEQAFLEGEIVNLDKEIKSAKVESTSGKKSIIHLGSVVTLQITGKEVETFTIVGGNEANPFENKISNESPVGVALLGKKKGEKIMIDTPEGKVEYTIIDIV